MRGPGRGRGDGGHVGCPPMARRTPAKTRDPDGWGAGAHDQPRREACLLLRFVGRRAGGRLLSVCLWRRSLCALRSPLTPGDKPGPSGGMIFVLLYKLESKCRSHQLSPRNWR